LDGGLILLQGCYKINRDYLQQELAKKGNNGQTIASALLEDLSLASDVIAGLSSTNGPVRFKSAKILSIISEAKPESLYSHFDFFNTLLGSNSNIIKWNAIDIIGNLVIVDAENRFERIFARYYGLLNEGSLITSAHVVENSGKIARAKPELRGRITAEILKVTEIPLPTSECRHILAGKAITAFSQYPELVTDKNLVVSFVSSQLNSARNATKKKAEAFLRNLE
jgi:hypothetical protein